nr:hypothetical protein [Halorubrum sp. SD626R]
MELLGDAEDVGVVLSLEFGVDPGVGLERREVDLRPRRVKPVSKQFEGPLAFDRAGELLEEALAGVTLVCGLQFFPCLWLGLLHERDDLLGEEAAFSVEPIARHFDVAAIEEGGRDLVFKGLLVVGFTH